MSRAKPSDRALGALTILVPVLAAALGACAPFLDSVQDEFLREQAAPVQESDYDRGKRELAAGRMGLAVLHFRTALAQAPDSIEALNGLGAAFDQLGRFDLSARAYSRALALAPQDAPTLNNLGYSYLLQGRYELAVAYLRDASIRAEGDARILANRSLAELALARAGGPAPQQTVAQPAGDPAQTEFKPHLVRAGKGLRRLVTRPAKLAPNPAPPGRGRLRAQDDVLPGFLSSPMDLGAPVTGGPVVGALEAAP